MMDVLGMTQKLIEYLKACDDKYGCALMHPSTAEKLLEHYIGVKCVIMYNCPTDRIYLMKDADLARKKYSNIGTAQYGQGVQKRIATNADRIRSMSDEEFSHFLFGIQCAPASRPKEWLDWLRQEADT